MSETLRVLFIEDSEPDLAMLLLYFSRSDFILDYRCVDSADGVRSALAERELDIVISDYSLPGFSGVEALRIAQESQCDVPFIIVSGNIGEETAVAAMKAGAADYIFKGNLQRLIPAVTREVRDARIRLAHRIAQQNLVRVETRYRHLLENIPATVYWTDSAHPLDVQYLSPQAHSLLGASLEMVEQTPSLLREMIHPEDRQRVRQAITVAADANRSYEIEYRLRRADGSICWVLDAADMLVDTENGPYFVQGVLLDITRMKEIEAQLRLGQEQLVELAVELSQVEERERRQMAIFLHDEISQVLAFAKNEIRAVTAALTNTGHDDRLQRLWGHLDRVYQQTKALSFELSPPILYDLGLAPAISWMSDQLHAQHGLTVAVETDGDLAAIPQEYANVLYRAVKELLTNIIKHAQVDQARVMLQRSDDLVFVQVADRGQGFSMPELAAHARAASSFGLFSLREQLRYFGGVMEIVSAPGKGTTVSLLLPLVRGQQAPPLDEFYQRRQAHPAPSRPGRTRQAARKAGR